MDLGDFTMCRRRHGDFHFHRFEDDHRIAVVDRRPRFGGDTQYLAWHVGFYGYARFLTRRACAWGGGRCGRRPVGLADTDGKDTTIDLYLATGDDGVVCFSINGHRQVNRCIRQCFGGGGGQPPVAE